MLYGFEGNKYVEEISYWWTGTADFSDECETDKQLDDNHENPIEYEMTIDELKLIRNFMKYRKLYSGLCTI